MNIALTSSKLLEVGLKQIYVKLILFLADGKKEYVYQLVN